jgi:peptidoglycan/LPS O-acetylase OafA/YrhL
MSSLTAPRAAPGSGAAQALFREARRRRRRRWLAGIAVVLVASAAVPVSSLTWLHRASGPDHG